MPRSACRAGSPCGARAAAAAAIAAWLLGLPDGVALVRENAAGILAPDGKVFAQTPEMWAAVRRHAAPDDRVANNPLFLQDLDAVAGQPVVGAAVGPSLVLRGPRVDAGLHALPRARREEIDAQFIRVFAGDASSQDIDELATRYGCRVVVVTAEDGAWRKDPFSASALYRLVEDDAHWRIYHLAAVTYTSGPPYRAALVQRRLNPTEPVEAAVLPIAAGTGVGDLHRGDPFRVLEAELRRRAQAQRKAERIGDRLAGVFGRQHRLRMQGGRHVDAAGVVVGASERDVFGGEVGADALEELAQIHARPLADVVPALDADVPDDDFLLGQRVDLLRGPGRLSWMRPASSSFHVPPSTGFTSSIS